MMRRNREKDLARKERRTERYAREDAAGKLLQRAPDLVSFDMTIRETRLGGCVSDTQYIRRVLVAQAPALFEVPCSDNQCEGGGYDVTREVLSALASRRTQFEGEQACSGQCGINDCARVLRYVATATYRAGRGAEPGPLAGTTAAT